MTTKQLEHSAPRKRQPSMVIPAKITKWKLPRLHSRWQPVTAGEKFSDPFGDLKLRLKSPLFDISQCHCGSWCSWSTRSCMGQEVAWTQLRMIDFDRVVCVIRAQFLLYSLNFLFMYEMSLEHPGNPTDYICSIASHSACYVRLLDFQEPGCLPNGNLWKTVPYFFEQNHCPPMAPQGPESNRPSDLVLNQGHPGLRYRRGSLQWPARNSNFRPLLFGGPQSQVANHTLRIPLPIYGKIAAPHMDI